MRVFRTYFRTIRNFAPMIAIYVVAFAAIVILQSTLLPSGSSFVAVKPRLAVVNHDVGAPLSESFAAYVGEHSDPQQIGDTEDAMKDALFYERVSAVLIIPEGFADDLMDDRDPQVGIMRGVSNDARFAEMLFSTYLGNAEFLRDVGMDQQRIADALEKDMEAHVTVEMAGVDDFDAKQGMGAFFNFANYAILAVIPYVVAMGMRNMNQELVRKRLLISPIPAARINRQVFLANALIAVAIYLVFAGIGAAMIKDVFTAPGYLMLLNLFALTMFALGLGVLLGTVLSNREAINGIVQVVSLGSSFLAGAFVPQSLLGEKVLTLARVLPSYWYVKANDDLVALPSYSGTDLRPVLLSVAVVAGFAAAMFLVSQVVASRRKRLSA